MTLFANGQSRDMPLVISDDNLMNEHNYFFSLIRSKSRPAVVTIYDAVHGLRGADSILQSLKERR